MSNIHFDYHEIEYPASTVAHNGNTGDEVVVLTLRNPDQWQPCNLGFTRSQAERLLPDLQRLLVATPLLLTLLVGFGCSARVDVATERSSGGEPAAVERLRTNVAVDLLTDKEETATPFPEPEQPPVSATTEEGVKVAGIANFAMLVEGDVHLHQHRHEHLHIETAPEPKRRKPKPERINVEIYTPRIDPECERLRREHEERVREWKALMSKYDLAAHFGWFPRDRQGQRHVHSRRSTRSDAFLYVVAIPIKGSQIRMAFLQFAQTADVRIVRYTILLVELLMEVAQHAQRSLYIGSPQRLTMIRAEEQHQHHQKQHRPDEVTPSLSHLTILV